MTIDECVDRIERGDRLKLTRIRHDVSHSSNVSDREAFRDERFATRPFPRPNRGARITRRPAAVQWWPLPRAANFHRDVQLAAIWGCQNPVSERSYIGAHRS